MVVQIKVLTVSKKVVNQLDCVYECFTRTHRKEDGTFEHDSVYDRIVSGQYKILGKIASDVIGWRNGNSYSLIVQKENSAVLIPYFSSIRKDFPEVETIVMV